MKAVGYTHCHPIGHEEALLDLHLNEPQEPKGHDILVEVRAVSVNPVDAKLRANADPAGEPRILGFDAAGVIRARGPQAHLFGDGEEVFYAGSVVRPGSNQQFQLVDERIVGRKPKTLSFAEAAAMPLAAITAWEALFDRLRIPRGKSANGEAVLIVGGAGGVGSIAIQLARRLTGLMVVATAARPETREWCERMGAHKVLDHSGDLAAQAKALGAPFPFVFSTTRTELHWKALVDIAAPQGTICAIDDIAAAPISALKPKCLAFAWEAMFARSMFQTPDMLAQHRLLDEVSQLLDSGVLRHTMTRNLGRVEAASLREGHALVEGGAMIGKAVCEGW